MTNERNVTELVKRLLDEASSHSRPSSEVSPQQLVDGPPRMRVASEHQPVTGASLIKPRYALPTHSSLRKGKLIVIYQPLFTQLRAQQKMQYSEAITAEHVRLKIQGLKTQWLRGSYQVEGDLMTQSKEMYDLALSASLLLHPQKAKFVAIMIDPPWKGTALKLRYRTLTNK